MTFQNPIGFMKRDEIPLTINGEEVTGFEIDLEDLHALGERYPWFGKQMAGEKVDVENVSRIEMLKVASAVIAVCVAPDAIGEDRKAVEASARNIKLEERAGLMQKILVTSFPQLAAAFESAEGNVPTPPKANRQQRRAGRSKDGGAKLRT